MQAKRLFFVWGAAAAIGLAGGCGSDATNPQDVVISEQAAQEFGAMIGDQAAGAVNSLTFSSSGTFPFQAATSVIGKSTPLGDVVFSNPLSLRWLADATCATFSDTTDSDGDGVPDDLTVSFSSPACTTAVNESLTVSLSGSFRVTDPGSNPGFDVSYSSLRLRMDQVGGSYIDIRVNGTQGVNATSTTADLNENVTLTWSFRDGVQSGAGTLSQNWALGFTAAEGRTYAVGSGLPDGSITLTGSTTVSSTEGAFAFSLTTPTPLVHSAACTESPTLTSGELHALVAGNLGGAFIRIQFIGCGQSPVITLVGRPAAETPVSG